MASHTGVVKTASESEKIDDGNGGAEDDDDDDESGKVQTLATFDELCRGDYEVILAHPEALLHTTFGKKLLLTESFTQKVIALVVNEYHTIEQWGGSLLTVFSQLARLPAMFECPVIALSATMTKSLL